MKMEFEILNTLKERITKPIRCSVELFPSYLKYIIEYNSERQNDDTDVWEKRYIFNNRTIKKSVVDNIILFYSNDSFNWFVEVHTFSNTDIDISFSTYENAKILFDKLNNWWIENILP